MMMKHTFSGEMVSSGDGSSGADSVRSTSAMVRISCLSSRAERTLAPADVYLRLFDGRLVEADQLSTFFRQAASGWRNFIAILTKINTRRRCPCLNSATKNELY
jgi:hypothetical protein